LLRFSNIYRFNRIIYLLVSHNSFAAFRKASMPSCKEHKTAEM